MNMNFLSFILCYYIFTCCCRYLMPINPFSDVCDDKNRTHTHTHAYTHTPLHKHTRARVRYARTPQHIIGSTSKQASKHTHTLTHCGKWFFIFHLKSKCLGLTMYPFTSWPSKKQKTNKQTVKYVWVKVYALGAGCDGWPRFRNCDSFWFTSGTCLPRQ